jgi:hypothetical protein
MPQPVLLSPGVFVLETDISQYIVTLSTLLPGLVITATKGVVNVPTLSTTLTEFINQFGIPDENHPGTIVARNYFSAGGAQLMSIRVTDSTDMTAMSTANTLSSGTYVLNAATSGSFYNNLAAVYSYGQQLSQTFTESGCALVASTPFTTTAFTDLPLAPGTLSISYSSAVIITDDGNGNLVFASGSILAGATGTVNYQTGVCSITPQSGYSGGTVTLVLSSNYFSTFNLQLLLSVYDSNDNLVSKNVLEQYNNLTLATFVDALAVTTNLEAPSSAPTHFPIAGTYAFSGGTDGIGSITDAAFIGNTLGTTPTGLAAFGFPDEIDLNLIAIPGRSSSSITEALITMASTTRADCMCLLDPPSNTTAQTVVAWANATGSYTSNEVIDSNYGAIYFPWYSSNNSITNNVDLAPPSAAAIQAFTKSQYWQAPAGPNRGILGDYAGISITLSPGDRQFLGENRINPIANLNGLGVMVLGQQTATLEASSLDRCGARMTLLVMEKAIATAMYALLFEQNNAQTWARAVNIVQPYLTALVNEDRIYAGVIYCDNITNTVENVNNNTMVAVVVVTLPKYAERILINFEATAYGVTITESLISNAVNSST